MGRKSKIRLTQNDRKEYARLVANTKAKVRRTVKNLGAIITDVRQDEFGNQEIVNVDIREEMRMPKLEDFKTRDEFNAWKERQQKFTSGRSPHFKFFKNEHGLIVTEHLTTVMENQNYRAQREAKKEREKVKDKPWISGGEVVATQGERMRLMARPTALGFNELKKFNLNDFFDFHAIERKFYGMKDKGSPEYYTQKKEQMQENFISLIERAFNSDANDLIKQLEGLSPEDFYEMYQMFDEFDFDIYYDTMGDPFGTPTQVTQLESYLEMYKNGFNSDLRPF